MSDRSKLERRSFNSMTTYIAYKLTKVTNLPAVINVLLISANINLSEAVW